MIPEKISDILRWSADTKTLEDSISKEADGETFTLLSNILRSLDVGDFTEELIPISNVTGEGMITLEATLSRILDFGEEVVD